jgi:LssY C-terminus
VGWSESQRCNPFWPAEAEQSRLGSFHRRGSRSPNRACRTRGNVAFTNAPGDPIMRLINRWFQRLLLLGLGVLSIWLIVFVFELTDRRLPWLLALALTYGTAACVVLPHTVRMGLKVLKRKRVPSYTMTTDGLPGDPVNIVLTGTLQQLQAAFSAAGWSGADRLNLRSSWRMIRAFVFNTPYPTAPFSTLLT